MVDEKCAQQSNCPVGNLTSPYVKAKREDTLIGWIFLVIGISHAPSKIDYECILCGKILESETNPEKLKQFSAR
jgi:hypothetical protein